MLTNFKRVSDINDVFFSKFAFMTNFGFTFGSHCGLYLLGSLSKDELLTGVVKLTRYVNVSIYYLIVIGLVFILSCLSTMIIGLKKFIAYKKEQEVITSIVIMTHKETNMEGDAINNRR